MVLYTIQFENGTVYYTVREWYCILYSSRTVLYTIQFDNGTVYYTVREWYCILYSSGMVLYTIQFENGTVYYIYSYVDKMKYTTKFD